MRLAIADPPYPPNLLAEKTQLRASRYYGERGVEHTYGARGTRPGRHLRPADVHQDAREWNDPERHRDLLAALVRDYDGWAVSTTPDAVPAVYAPLPRGCRVLTWVKTNALPTSSRVASRTESVIAFLPETRRKVDASGQVPDFLIAASPRAGFAGAKPVQWTRWVLDALGYDPDVDQVDDLFPGSGAVAAAIRARSPAMTSAVLLQKPGSRLGEVSRRRGGRGCALRREVPGLLRERLDDAQDLVRGLVVEVEGCVVVSHAEHRRTSRRHAHVTRDRSRCHAGHVTPLSRGSHASVPRAR